MPLDVDFVRSQFPAFQAGESKNWIYFENAGGSYVPATVINRLHRFFVEHKVQPYGVSSAAELEPPRVHEDRSAFQMDTKGSIDSPLNLQPWEQMGGIRGR